MSEKFDAHKEAERVESLANQLIDEMGSEYRYPIEAQLSESMTRKQFTDEVTPLGNDPGKMRVVGEELEHLNEGSIERFFTTEPNVRIYLNEKGDVRSLLFLPNNFFSSSFGRIGLQSSKDKPIERVN